MTKFREATVSPNLRVDREGLVIRGVKILGKESRNGRTYSDEAMKQASRLYENVKVNVDHPSRGGEGDRGMSDFFGTLKRIEVKPDGVYGDLHYLESHSLTNQILESAERFPDQLGLSHVAEGNLNRETKVVESVERVRSVDIVSEPATVAGLFESEGDEDMGKMVTLTMRECVRRVAGRPGVKILEQEDVAAVLDPEAEVEVPAEVAADETGSDDMMKQALMSKISEVIEDTSLDFAATKKAVIDILNMMSKTIGMPGESDDSGEMDDVGEGGDSGGGDSGGGEETTEESAKWKKKAELLEAKETATNLLVSMNRKPTAERISAVAGVPAAQRKKLVESWPEEGDDQRRERPSRSRSIRESKGGSRRREDRSAKEFAKDLLR